MKTTKGLLIAHNEMRSIDVGDHIDINTMVGGWFDAVRNDTMVGYVHDEGLLLGLPLNPIATALFGRIIAGPCVLVGSINENGEYDGYNHDLTEADLLKVVYLADAYKMWAEAHLSHCETD